MDALADREPVAAGRGDPDPHPDGGDWGDPLDRPYDEVWQDVPGGPTASPYDWV